MRVLIKNVRVINPLKKQSQIMDIAVDEGNIAKIARHIPSFSGARVFAAEGMLACPGLVDMHVHLRDPGYEYKETIASGTRAAGRGGFTTVCCMPNTNPPIDSAATVEYILKKSAQEASVRILPIGAITKGLAGAELSEIGDLKAAGVVAISDDGRPVSSAEIMRRAMEYAGMFCLPVISHCETEELSAGGVMNEGFVSTVLGLKGIPRLAEITMASRDIEIARYTGGHIHIAHVSCKETVDLVRRAKKEKVRVSCECTPHHFTLSDEAVLQYDTNTKVNPPLRTAADITALKKGLADGTIDCIVTDHAPHAAAEKDVEYDLAPFGIVGLETAVGLCASELVHTGVLTWEQLIAKMSLNPCRVLNIDGGCLREGVRADITIIDPQREWTVDPSKFKSRSRNTPFGGRALRGDVVLTICNGIPVYSAEPFAAS